MSRPVEPSAALRILHLEDDPGDAELIRRALAAGGIDGRITYVDCRDDFERALVAGCDLVLADYTLPRFDGLSALELAAAHCPKVPFIFVSGSLGEEIAIESLKRGATDYILKDHLSRLAPAAGGGGAGGAGGAAGGPRGGRRPARRALDEAAARREVERAEAKLRETRQQLQMAVEIARLGSWEWDLCSGSVHYSEQWKKQLGYEPDEIGERREEWESRLHPNDRQRTLDALMRFLANPSTLFEAEFRLRHKDGSYRWFASRASIRQHDGQALRIVGTDLDITARKEAEERVRHAAQHDPLTGLANRALIYEFAEHLLSHARRGNASVAFLFFDLDRFKPINDTYGHAVGDEVIRQIGERLAKCVRREDIVGRLGGDEFLAVLADVGSAEDAARVARHATGCLTRPYQVFGFEFQLSFSIGISLFPRDGDNVDTLLRNADAAMYYSKDNGRNSFQFYTEELNQRAAEALAIENAMRGSLERGEFELHYQPLFDTRSGEVTGVEALMRWQRGAEPGVGPEQFIPIAELNGLIRPLGDWAIREACRQHQEWRAQGLPAIPVAINVAALQFRQGHIQNTIACVIEETGIAPDCVHLEVTESTVMRNVDEAAAILDGLKSLGLKVALDDFGTGYSSLAYLRRLPVDQLKVDRSFVKNACADENSQLITEAVIGLAHSLKLEVVAEGIESEAALEFVRERRCDQAQGYLLCRPLSGTRFAEWYKERIAARGRQAQGQPVPSAADGPV